MEDLRELVLKRITEKEKVKISRTLTLKKIMPAPLASFFSWLINISGR